MKADSKDPPRPRLANGAVFAALVLLGLAACSSEPDVTPAPAVADASTDEAPTSDAGPDDAAATGQSGPVRDVTWMIGDAPASWTKLEVGDGEKQWQVRDECLFTMDQPSGIDPGQVPVEQVLQDTGTKIQNALGFPLDSGPVTTQSFPVTSNEAAVASADVSTIGYTACSANVPFDEVNEEEFAPFINEQISINLEY